MNHLFPHDFHLAPGSAARAQGTPEAKKDRPTFHGLVVLAVVVVVTLAMAGLSAWCLTRETVTVLNKAGGILFAVNSIGALLCTVHCLRALFDPHY